MSVIALISCVKTKAQTKSLARDMYISSLFKKSLEYVETVLKPNKCFILSEKYGLLPLNQEIEPYEKTLNNMSSKERIEWANDVWKQLQNECDTANDEFIFLAGKKYYEHLIKHMQHKRVLMEGMGNGERLHWLNEQLRQR